MQILGRIPETRYQHKKKNSQATRMHRIWRLKTRSIIIQVHIPSPVFVCNPLQNASYVQNFSWYVLLTCPRRVWKHRGRWFPSQRFRAREILRVSQQKSSPCYEVLEAPADDISGVVVVMVPAGLQCCTYVLGAAGFQRLGSWRIHSQCVYYSARLCRPAALDCGIQRLPLEK